MVGGDRSTVAPTFIFIEECSEPARQDGGPCPTWAAILKEGIHGGIQSLVFIQVALGFLDSIEERSRRRRDGSDRVAHDEPVMLQNSA